MSTEIRQIKLGITGVKPIDLVSKANVIIYKMADNPHFPSPSPTISDIQLAKDKLSEAITDASMGDRYKIMLRNIALEKLKSLLRGLGHYVSIVANGDGSILISSGFELQKLREPMPPVTTPLKFIVTRIDIPGCVKLRWKAVKGAKIYVVEYKKRSADANSTEWKQAMMTSKSSAVIEDLELGTYYNFRIKAVGKNNESGWSEKLMVMAA